ncbi:MAG: hypothetical protein ACD_67C00124G0003 [uncultured bacterium]|nr:MAG: hypothetical protein ACD_67C00124G0003 [uncultured bacterium]
MNKRKIITGFWSVFTLVFATASWLSVRNAVIVPDSSTWFVPMALFSIYIILICLDIILFHDILLLELVLVASLATSAFFAFEWLQLLGILISAYFLFLSSRKIRWDMELNLIISPWKSMQAGKSYLLISLTFLIAMQYFLTIRNFDGEKKVPHFDSSFITKKIAIPFIASVNPQFEVLNDETLTVDEFILQTQNSTQDNDFLKISEEMIDAQIPENLTPTQREMIKKQAMENFSSTNTQVSQKSKELILSIGHKQFSDIVGAPVTGNEKISDVFTGLINDKVNDYFNPKVENSEKSSVFSLILALVLLLIIYPIGSILSIAWFLTVKFVIFILLKTKAFNVKKVTVSKEILE